MLDNDTVLGAYIGMVRRQRGLRPDQDVKVRQEDLEALSEALDLDDDELEERLVRVIGMSRTQAAAVRAQLLRRRLAVPMVGMLAALSLLGANRIFTTATEQVKTVAGGAITRGNPFAGPTTTATTVLPSATIESPDNTATTAPTATAAPTLPPVVTDGTLVGPAQPSRTGPPRTKPREPEAEVTDPSAADPVPTDTAAPPAPSATPAPTTTTTTTTTSTLEPPPPAVVPIGTPGVQETTTQLPTTTTTTTVAPTTTDPAGTTTTTVTTVGGGNTTETTEPPPPPPGSSPLNPVETTPDGA
jgi:hypothetical protein